MVPLGIRIYGLGAMAIGGVGLVWGDFALQWQPVAAGFPGRTTLAYIFSAALLVAGALMNYSGSRAPRASAASPGAAAMGSVALATLYALVVIFMHGPQIFQHPGAFPAWDGAAEQLALSAGGLSAWAYLAGAGNRHGTSCRRRRVSDRCQSPAGRGCIDSDVCGIRRARSSARVVGRPAQSSGLGHERNQPRSDGRRVVSCHAGFEAGLNQHPPR